MEEDSKIPEPVINLPPHLDPNHAFYTGELTSTKLKRGPLDKRHMTNCASVVVFCFFWVLTWAIAYSSYRGFHDHKPQVNVTASYGELCQDTTPYLYFVEDNSTVTANNTVCISECPMNASSALNCSEGYETGNPGKTCAEIPVNSTDLLFGAVCWPQNTVLQDILLDGNPTNKGMIMRLADDLEDTWGVIFIVGCAALALGFVYLLMLKRFSTVLIWGSLVFCLVVILIFGLMFFVVAQDMSDASPDGADTNGTSTDDTSAPISSAILMRENMLMQPAIGVVKDYLPGFTSNFSKFQMNCMAYLSLILVVVFTGMVCFYKDRINLSIAVVRAASDFIDDEKKILFVPPIFFIKSLIFYLLWIYGLVMIVGDETEQLHYNKEKIPIPYYDWRWESIFKTSVFFFAFAWHNTFGNAWFQFVVGNTTCFWYFKQGTQGTGDSPVWKSFGRSVYHWGSIAFGSIVIGMLGFLRPILSYINSKVNKLPEGEKEEDIERHTDAEYYEDEHEGEREEEVKGRGFCASCCGCGVSLFEKGYKYYTHHVYIQIALTGDDFDKATRDAYYLMVRNKARFQMVNGIAKKFLQFGQLLIAFVSTYLGYLYITTAERYKEKQVDSPLLVSMFFLVLAYLIGDVFMGVYTTSSDAIIHCFAMDEEMNDGKPEYVPKWLSDSVSNHLEKKLLLNDYE